jgi:signal transduction histidine kinase
MGRFASSPLRYKRCIIFAVVVFALLSSFSTQAQKFIGTRLEYLPESYNLDLLEVEVVAESEDWISFEQLVPNLGMGAGVEWIRLTLDPMTENGKLIEIQNAGIDDLTCYMVCDGKIIASYPGGIMNTGVDGHQFRTYPSFPVPLVECTELHALFRMQSNKPMIVPLRITGPRKVLEDSHQRDVLFALYAGVMLVMLLYNLFLFLSIGDRSYLEYVLFIFAVGGAQLVLNGYGFILGADHWPWLNLRLTHLFGVFSGLTTIMFVQNFLRLSRYVPWLHKLLNGYFLLYLLALVLALIGRLEWSYQLINFCAAAIFFIIPGAIITIRKGYNPAKYFLLAFTVFIFAVFIFVLKDSGVIPYNAWTFYALPMGSAIEVVVLSLALASRINQLKRESVQAREEQLRVSQLNEQMVREQNSVLEERVAKRTAALESANSNIQNTLDELQSAQQQLVQSEKLASIGQLTAGIAHELNNPINFVASSAQSLRRDFEDLSQVINKLKGIDPLDPKLNQKMVQLKEIFGSLDIEFTQREIEELLNGIEDGTKRTSEIVKGLRIFSRMDGDNFTMAQINELIESTLIVLRSNLKDYAVVESDMGVDLPLVSCQPGRLNQVFMNIITNASQSMEESGLALEERKVQIASRKVDSIGQSWIEVRVKDQGVGMSEAVKAQIFDPFFTTKAVGEGTGLGLSIVMGILSDHNAEVEVETEEGVGTEFIIRFPL